MECSRSDGRYASHTGELRPSTILRAVKPVPCGEALTSRDVLRSVPLDPAAWQVE